jgi:hypothetical protein
MMKSRSRGVWRKAVLWFSRVALRLDLRNARPCGCVDLYRKGQDTFQLLPCDSCGAALSKMLSRDDSELPQAARKMWS